MDQLMSYQRLLQDSSLAASTRRSHRSQLQCYSRFCERYTLSAFPCLPRQACLYAAFLSEWMAHASIVNYLSAVWHHQLALGFPSYSSDFILTQTLRGIRRSFSRHRPTRLPLSVPQLLSLFQEINTLLPQDLTFWAAVTLAFRALLRKCHYTSSCHMLLWQDISIYPDHLALVLRSSKTDQFSSNPHRVLLNSSPGSALCPVFWLSELARIHHPSELDPVFRIPVPGGLVPISSAWFNKRLKTLSALIGLDPSIISSHSLRHGGASFMASLGADIADIRARGSWASSAIFRYLHHSDDTLRAKDALVSSSI